MNWSKAVFIDYAICRADTYTNESNFGSRVNEDSRYRTNVPGQFPAPDEDDSNYGRKRAVFMAYNDSLNDAMNFNEYIFQADPDPSPTVPLAGFKKFWENCFQRMYVREVPPE